MDERPCGSVTEPDEHGLSGRSSWSSDERKSISGAIRVHLQEGNDSSASTIDFDEFVDMQLYRELVRPHDGKIYCEIILRCREEHVFTKSIIVSSGRNIEIFGSAAQGYISSSHGTLVDDFEGTTVYGHVLDLRSVKVSELELRIFPVKPQTRVIFYGVHIYLKKVFEKVPECEPEKSMPSHTTGLADMVIPVNFLLQKLDSLRKDMLSMEERLKLYMNGEIAVLKLQLQTCLPDANQEPSTSSNRYTRLAFYRGSLNLVVFKRLFLQEDICATTLPYLLKSFDAESYSIWFCAHKFPQELTDEDECGRFIQGMFHRLETMRRNAFASLMLFGHENNYSVSGVWIWPWPGQELIFRVNTDWCHDYESFTWRKLDATDSKDQETLSQYLSGQGEFDGKVFRERKIFM